MSASNQTRVLALIRRYHLTKDQTAQLIDWWQAAGEEERCHLEEKGGFPLPPPAGERPALGVDPGRYATELLQHCTLALDQLTVFLRQQAPPFTWWPHNHYHTFLRAVAVMADFVPRA